MLQAQQRALLQETNQGLISIRNAELDYYTTFYATFGGQSALIGGFTYSAITQSNIFYGFINLEATNFALLSLWWISSSISLAAAMHCIFTTILLQVLGPGLALTGPIGSMARATRGLHEEMNQVFTAYIIMVLAFAISVTSSFWVIMAWEGSLICTVIFVYSAIHWWFYCSRIYNRFYETTFFYDGEREVHFADADKKQEDDDDPLGNFKLNTLKKISEPADISNSKITMTKNVQRIGSDRENLNIM